jgi:hypothetical protein
MQWPGSDPRPKPGLKILEGDARDRLAERHGDLCEVADRGAGRRRNALNDGRSRVRGAEREGLEQDQGKAQDA